MPTTTIQIRSSTRQKRANLKASSRGTYDELINKLIALVPGADEEGSYSRAFRLGLLQARLDIKEQRVVTHGELKRRLRL